MPARRDRVTLLPIAALLALAACGPSPREACIARATEELDTLDALIAETEANLLRGYALEPEPRARAGLRICAGGGGPLSVCAERSGEVAERPVAIDPVAERMKLANLRARREGLAVMAEREKAACEARFRR
jgi:hypothetical protein